MRTAAEIAFERVGLIPSSIERRRELEAFARQRGFRPEELLTREDLAALEEAPSAPVVLTHEERLVAPWWVLIFAMLANVLAWLTRS